MPKMFPDAYLTKVRERFLQLASSDDTDILRDWRVAVNHEIAEHICDNVKPTIADFMERMSAMDVDYRSQLALSSAAGITNLYRILVQRRVLDAIQTLRVLSCCTGKNNALSGELVRMLLDYAPQQIPLAADHLGQLCHQNLELPRDRKATEIFLSIDVVIKWQSPWIGGTSSTEETESAEQGFYVVSKTTAYGVVAFRYLVSDPGSPTIPSRAATQ